jgi:hypothetical protein
MSGDYLHRATYAIQEAAETLADLADPAPHLDGPHPHAARLKAFAGALGKLAELVRAVDLDLSQDSTLTPAELVTMGAVCRALTPRDASHGVDCWGRHLDCAAGRIDHLLAWLDKSEAEIEAGGGPTGVTLCKHSRRILGGNA